MKAITIYQPWAQFLATGAKEYETRGWFTKYRGPIAIHAGKTTKYVPRPLFRDALDGTLPLGAIVGVADLVAVIPTTGAPISDTERELGDWREGRFGWKLANVKRLKERIYINGRQGLWDVPEWALERIKDALASGNHYNGRTYLNGN